MKNVLKILSLIIITFAYSCNKEDEEDLLGNWVNISDFEGLPRSEAVGFTIENKGYLGTGYDGDDRLNDFWEYNPETEFWTQLNDISNSTDSEFDDSYTINRSHVVAFAINGKGYIATGGIEAPGLEIWEYDPITDLWEEKTNFEGYDRMDAVGFALDGRGYVIAGRSSSYYFDDVWAFDPNVEYDEYD